MEGGNNIPPLWVKSIALPHSYAQYVIAFTAGKTLHWESRSLPRLDRDKYLHLRAELDMAEEGKIEKND